MRSSVKGPLRGAYGLLASGALTAMGTSLANTNIAVLTVPSTEDWYPTAVQAYAGTAGSAAGTVDVLDDGVSILSAVLTLATTGTSRTVAASSGEDEGVKVATGSIVRLAVTSSATTAPGNIVVQVYGYARSVLQP